MYENKEMKMVISSIERTHFYDKIYTC